MDDQNINQLNTDLGHMFEHNMLDLQRVIRQKKEDWSSELLDVFNKCFMKLSIKQQKNIKGKLKYISFSILLTSILTEKYSLGVNFYDEKFYLDESNIFDEFKLKYIYDYASKDIQEIKMWLRKSQLPYNEGELFEIKKIIILSYVAVWVKELQDKIIQCLNKLDREDVGLYEKIDITFGSYLEKQVILCTWEVE